MNYELKALKDNGTWSVLPLLIDSFAIGCKWVFKVEMNADDYSLFTMTIVNGEFSALLVYVDDIVIASTTIQAVNHVKQYLSFQFKLKDLGTLKYFLGLEIARS
ncbi:Uncharacterized protein TCM_018954 [Theobroma cacao]|uniref:Reverse transcriptase Ty1/copia-type domain-containing protein n=1 Tax=Theobroma cacao TaxID=3641 RepID=A0A061EFJ4_THECC|nr:Uncharacterized protein TCM_018954 [Theobroma cacao]